MFKNRDIPEMIEKQPPFGAIKRPGKVESRAKLKKLGFDPIEKLVNLYNKLEQENEFYCKLREVGQLQELDNMGEPIRTVRYSHIAHTNILSQLEQVSSQLLRYRYARVPETINMESSKIPTLNINLTGVDDESM